MKSPVYRISPDPTFPARPFLVECNIGNGFTPCASCTTRERAQAYIAARQDDSPGEDALGLGQLND